MHIEKKASTSVVFKGQYYLTKSKFLFSNIFLLFLSVYPVFPFPMSNSKGNSSVDATQNPDGCITSDSTFNGQPYNYSSTNYMKMTIDNLPETAIITIEMNGISLASSYIHVLAIRNAIDFFDFTKRFVRNPPK